MAAHEAACMLRRLSFLLLAALFLTPAATPALTLSTRSRLALTRATLPNGLQIVVLRDTLAPVVTTWLNVEAGSDDEPYAGLAHAQEHMFYRGSTTLSGTQADEIAGFTGDEDNADTQSAITQYFHTVPTQDLAVALQLDAHRFVGLLDSQHDWSEERGAIEQEVSRDNSDATFRLEVKLQRHLMAGTPYADDGLGTIASFDKQIDAPQLQTFYKKWYRPNDAIYVIAGDVDADTAIAAVRKYFGAIPAAPLPARSAVHLGALGPVAYNDRSDQASTEALVGYRFPGYASEDYAASVVLGDVLNNQRGDLYGLVAAGKALAIEADPNPFPSAGFLILLSHVPVSTQPLKAIADMKAVIARYRATGVPANLVESAKQREIAQTETAEDSLRGLAALWSQTLAVEHRTPQDDLAAIARVTPAAVNRVLRDYLDNATASVATAVPKNGGAVGGSDEGGASSENAKTAPTKLESLPAWAETALHAVRAPARTTDPTAFTLPNGLHVVVQPEHASSAVVVNGTILHDAGLNEPPHEAGVGDLVEALLPFGTTTDSRLTYQAKVDAIAATIHTGYAFSLGTLATNFDRGMQLLAEDELHPALAQHDFDIVRMQRYGTLAGDATTPDHLAAVAAADHLFPRDDPARHFPSADDVKNLTLAAARAHYAASFRPDVTTIAIVGDITPEQARASVERWFGGWQRTGPAPRVFPPSVPNNRPAAITVPATGRTQDTVVLRQTLPVSIADPDIAPLLVANTVLSGDFSSILVRDMRVTTGYVYFVGTSLAAGKTRTTFDVTYACAPKNFSKAQAVLVRDLRRLQREPIDAERLQRAKARLVSTTAIVGASYDGLAAALLANASLGLPLDNDVRRAREELAASPVDVRIAAARWLRATGFVRIVEGPAPRGG
jgi:zinc protease